MRALHHPSVRTIALSTASALALAVSGVEAPPASAQEDAAGAERIVVTGSRIARRDFSVQSPLVTVQAESLLSSEVSIDQQLTKLPQFGAGTNQLTEANATQSSPTESPGVSTVNLRGLGSNRTLVLLDGRRTQPANASLVVDLNTIPAAALDSIEIITGGAAATYGADAVAGVVNFKLRTDFEGAAFDSQYGLTDRGDGAQTLLSALLGGNFADDRGNALVALSYADRGSVFARDRDFFVAPWSDPDIATGAVAPGFAGFAPGPGEQRATQEAIDEVFTARGFAAGAVSSGSSIYFNPAATTTDATLFSVGSVSLGLPAVGYEGGLFPDYKILSNGFLDSNNTQGQISLPLTRFSSFARAHYELDERLTVYAQAQLSQSNTETRFAYSPAVLQWSATVPRDDAHPVPDELATLLNSRNTPDAPWRLDRRLDFMGPNGLDTTTHTYELLLGARGDVGFKDWSYDVFWSRGKTYIVNEYVGFIDLARYQFLINLPNYGVVTDPITGPLTNFRLGRSATCTSGLNPFLSTPVSQDCIDVLDANAKSTMDVVQDQVEANIEGHLIDLPAGEARFAIGADWRKNHFEFKPDGELSTTNIVSTVVGLFDTTPTGGAVEVAEVYGEALIPLLSDLPLVQSASLNAGYRYSEYEGSAGGVSTWKATGDWVVSDWLTFRGGYQLANRAPNVAELFLPPTFLTVPWPDHDPCSILTIAPYGNVPSNPDRAQVQALCTALSGFPVGDDFIGNVPSFFPLARDEQIGNPDLEPEEADTWTFGAVIRSPFDVDGLRNLTVAIDYYDITIDGAIEVKSTPDVYRECFNATGANPTYDPEFEGCDPIIRSNIDGRWLATIARYGNLGQIATSGVDVQAEWSAELPAIGGGSGAVFANLGFNYLDTYEVQNVPGGPILDYADASNSPNGAQFRWKLFATVGADVGPATVSLGWRHLPEVRNAAVVTNPASGALPTKAYDVFDLAARWEINDTLELRGGIDNVLDADPPRVGVDPGRTTAAGQTDPATYDILGRRFFIGARARF